MHTRRHRECLAEPVCLGRRLSALSLRLAADHTGTCGLRLWNCRVEHTANADCGQSPPGPLKGWHRLVAVVIGNSVYAALSLALGPGYGYAACIAGQR